MRKFIMFVTASVVLLVGGLAWAQKTTVKQRQLIPVIPPRTAQNPLPFAVTPISVLPGAVSFTSSNPDGSVAGLPATTTVSFRVTANPAAFRVWAQASSVNFTGCNNPPASHVTLACSSPSGVTCQSGALPLSSSPPPSATLVASGAHNQNPATFVVTYTFQDSWNYQVGAACSLSVSYIYTEP